jgi:hypothetical protein
MLLPLLRMEAKRWAAVAKVGTVAHKGAANMGFSHFLHCSLHLEAAANLATITLHISSMCTVRHVGQLRTASCQQLI